MNRIFFLSVTFFLAVFTLLWPGINSSWAFLKITELATTDSHDEFFRVALGDGYAFWSHYGEGIYAWQTSDPVTAGHRISNEKEVTEISAYGSKVAWIDDSDDIILWDEGSLQELEDDVVDGFSIYGQNVVFVEEDHENFLHPDTEIFLRVPGKKIQISDNDYDDKQPSLYENTVAWVGRHDDNFDLFFWDGKNEYKLTDSDGDDLKPSIHKGAIAWMEWDGDDYEIYYWAGGQNIQITDDDENDEDPVLRDGRIVWIKDDGDCEDIYMWDGSHIKKLTDECYDKISSLDFNGEAVLWSAQKGSDKSVYFAKLPNDRSMTGWWYNSAEPGTGLATQVSDGRMFVTWFVYDGLGRTSWYSAGGEMDNRTSFSGTLYSWSGWPWGTPYFAPTPKAVGNIVVNFDTPEEGKVTFTVSIDGKVVTKTFSSFMEDFAPGNEDSRHITGWWYDPAFNGMGFFLDAQGGRMALAWYNYREDGTSRWWTSYNYFSDGAQIYLGSLDGWKDGQCSTCPYSGPPKYMQGEGGSITITFQDEEHAQAQIGDVLLHLERFHIP